MSSLPRNLPEPHGPDWAARLIPGSRRPYLREKTALSSYLQNGRAKNRGNLFNNYHSAEAFSERRDPKSSAGFRASDPKRQDRALSILSSCFNDYSTRVARGSRHVLIVGSCALGRQIVDYVHQHPEGNRLFCGFMDDKKPLGNGVVGRISDLPELARRGFVDELIVASPLDRDRTHRLLQTARELRLDVKLAQPSSMKPVEAVERIGSIPLLSLHEEKIPVCGLLVKRALDIIISLTTIIFLAPALALLSALIKLDSAGPVFYKALRAGRKGKPFLCLKFRTMQRDADDLKQSLRPQNQRSGPFFKIKNDPRITRIGKLLRRYSLDELPQLWNVFRGEMSLVGPRPHPLDDVAAYRIEHLSRLDVLPGITGLWQVTARRDPSFQTGMKLDTDYIRNWNLGMDFRILFRTAGAVFQGSGD